MTRRKQAVSVRMNVADVRKVKKLAQRLGAGDSDVIRFAVRLALSRLAPLLEPGASGRALLPVFVEAGDELMQFFELDATRLDVIVNEGVAPELRVDMADLSLIAMSGAAERYAELQLTRLTQAQLGAGTPAEGSGALRRYIYDKYVFNELQGEAARAGSRTGGAPAQSAAVAAGGSRHG